MEEGQPRDNAWEIVLAEVAGGVVSELIGWGTRCVQAGVLLSQPEFIPVIEVGGNTLSYLASNKAVAMVHDGWDYIFGHNYHSEYNAEDKYLTLNVNSLKDGFNDYWSDKRITAMDENDNDKIKYSLTLSECWISTISATP